MEKNAFNLGDKVISIRRNSGYAAGDIFIITDMQGLIPNEQVNSDNYYLGLKIFPTRNRRSQQIYHGDLVKLNSKEGKNFIEDEIKRYTKKLENLNYILDIMNKHEISLQKFYENVAQDIINAKNSKEVIMEILKRYEDERKVISMLDISLDDTHD